MPAQQQKAVPLIGRALDVAVAEAVLGLRVVALDWPCGYQPDGAGYEASMCPVEEDQEQWRPDAVYVPAGGRWPPERIVLGEGDAELVASVQPVPWYSTQIEAAWVVVEALQARGWWLQMTTVTEGWLIIVLQPVSRRVLARVVASTCSEALCRAALVAVMAAGEMAQEAGA